MRRMSAILLLWGRTVVTVRLYAEPTPLQTYLVCRKTPTVYDIYPILENSYLLTSTAIREILRNQPFCFLRYLCMIHDTFGKITQLLGGTDKAWPHTPGVLQT